MPARLDFGSRSNFNLFVPERGLVLDGTNVTGTIFDLRSSNVSRFIVDKSGSVGIGPISSSPLTIDARSQTNIAAITVNNVGAGTGGITLGVMGIGHSQDNARMIAFRITNKAISYSHGGATVASQGVHRFSSDNNGGTGAGANGSILDILAPTTATNIFQCRQADETLVFNVKYNGDLTVGNSTVNTVITSTTATLINLNPLLLMGS